MVDNILNMDKEVFLRPLRDNSEWDGTVNYIENPSRGFEKECLTTLPSTFSFDHIWVFNRNGNRIFYYHRPGSVDLDTILSDVQIKQRLNIKTPIIHFFLNTSKGLVELSGATVVPTVHTKHDVPAKGYLFFARNWDSSVLKHLEKITGSMIKVGRNGNIQEASSPEDFFAVTHDLYDADNVKIADLVFTFPLTYFGEWKRDSLSVTYIYIFTSILFVLIIGFLSRRWLSIPLKSIVNALNTGDHHYLQPLKTWKNEFGEIARLIEDSIIIKDALNEEVEYRAETEKILSSLKNKAEESDRLKTAFLSNMSHEIRTPMNCILGFIQLLEQEDYTEEERHQYMSMVSSSGNQLLTIINDILDIAKIESNQMMLLPTHFNLNNLLDKMLVVFSNEKNRNRKNHLVIELKKGIDGPNCHVFCDQVRLEQILNNLLSNALKFTFTGKITFGYSVDKEKVSFFVQDTGLGISPENIEIVFERFRQEEETLSKNSRGTGLGLPISKGLVELMGGKMWLTSEKGSGSTFYFELPGILRSDTALVDKAVPRIQQSLSLSGKTILVAEDVAENVELITIMLKQTHVTILRAENGQVAVELCLNNPSIDLVLMDIQMPVMNGYDATREIRKHRPDLPIIALTAYAFEKDKSNSLEAGCNDFLPKPIQKKDLLTKLSQYFNG